MTFERCAAMLADDEQPWADGCEPNPYAPRRPHRLAAHDDGQNVEDER
jgi:hypothetical protein